MRIFGAPRQYIQGPGVIAKLGAIARRCKATPLLIADSGVRTLLGDDLTKSFDAPPIVLECTGEITLPAVEALTNAARGLLEPEVRLLVYGVGGGKALDTAKAVARRLEADFVAVPTVASNDSPTGRAVAVYDEQHKLAAIEHIASSPEAVVVDTALIAGGPARFLRGGIGDAISKKFEAERAAADGGVNFFGTAPLNSALALADACYATLREHAPAAMRDIERHDVTPALEATIEACLLMSGIAWESGGVSLAHAIVRGIARTPGAEAVLHGEHVAYGLLVQLAVQDASDAQLDDLISFNRAVGLPTHLADMGIAADPPEPVWRQIAEWAHDGPKGGNLIVSASVADLTAAIARIEQRARSQLR